MNRIDLLNYHKITCENARALMDKKNHDYAGATGDDPFKNFRVCEIFGICSVEQGIGTRLADKFSRVGTFLSGSKILVESESFEDTVLDTINYLVLLSAYLHSKKEQ